MCWNSLSGRAEIQMEYIGVQPFSDRSNLLILRAGDGDRTRDVQLGKLAFN